MILWINGTESAVKKNEPINHRLGVWWLARTLVTSVTLMLLHTSLVRADAYDPPVNYYSTATGTGATLKSQLYGITSTGFVGRSYGNFRYASAILDADPKIPGNIQLVYNRASVSGTWDLGVTWNREHVWPQSLLGVSVSNAYVGVGSDLFELRPANPGINSSRSNYPYGTIHAGSLPAYGLVRANDATGTYWYPGAADRGEVARSLFYMATRYGQGQASNLNLINGQPSVHQMGDLESLLHWNYQSPVDDTERRRNQYAYDPTFNPTYYQGNRNPYIDHPEYVWSIFGTGANTSQLSVATPLANGESTASVNLGRVIRGSAFGTQPVTISKSGATPTTFDVLTSGAAASTFAGPRHAFDYGSQSNVMQLGLTGSTGTAGPITGSLTVHNTDLTSAASGQGSADGNDVVQVSGTVVDHSNASFSLAGTQKSLTIDFGQAIQGSGTMRRSFSVADSFNGSIYTAGLNLDSILASGNTSSFSTDLAAFSNLTAGSSNDCHFDFATDSPGSFSASYTLGVSDENIPGATAGQNLFLNVIGTVVTPEPATMELILIPGILLVRRKRR